MAFDLDGKTIGLMWQLTLHICVSAAHRNSTLQAHFSGSPVRYVSIWLAGMALCDSS